MSTKRTNKDEADEADEGDEANALDRTDRTICEEEDEMNNVEQVQTFKDWQEINDESLYSLSCINQPGSSLMQPNSSLPAGASLIALNRSQSVGHRDSSINIPGAECLSSTQTLPLSKPSLQPGMSVIDDDKCHSAPVKTDSSFFTHNQSLDANMPGTSTINLNGASLTSINSFYDDGRHRGLQPGMSVLSNANSELGSSLSTSPEMFRTALVSCDDNGTQVKNSTLSDETNTRCKSWHFRCAIL